MTLNTLIPLNGMWYKIVAISDDGALTLTPAGQTSAALRKSSKALPKIEAQIRAHKNRRE